MFEHRGDVVNHRGFSLVELVVVAMVVAILAAIAVPRYARSATRYRAELAAERIAEDLQLVRSRARATGARQTVQFDLPSNTYQMPGDPHPDHPGDPYLVDLKDGPASARLLSASFGGATELEWDPFGHPAAGGDVTVVAGEFRRTVTVDPNSGVVEVR